MTALTQVIDNMNRRRALFGASPIDLRSSSDVHTVAQELDCCLSPENIHMDGECSHTEAERRWKYYSSAARELQTIDPSVVFDELY